MRFDRQKREGGGSCFYVREDCIAKLYHFNTLFPKYVEVNIIQLELKFSKPILIINIYNPPNINKTHFINSLNNLLVEISKFRGKILIMGDLKDHTEYTVFFGLYLWKFFE